MRSLSVGQVALSSFKIRNVKTVQNVCVAFTASPVEVMAPISPGPSPDISPISSLMVEMSLFSSASHLSMFHWTKLKFQHRLLGDSSVNLTLIQPSTVHGWILSLLSLGDTLGSRVHLGQVASPSQGHTETNRTHSHARSQFRVTD